MLQEGDILKDRYKVQQLIGRGGMSRVFMGTDLRLTNKLWAIKEVSKNATDQAGRPIEQSLAIEAELLSKLDHPMIVDIADIVTTDECIYVVMDYVEGMSLDKVIRENGPQSEEDVQDWALQICDALDYLHNQDPPIIYRDMKPSNIMLRPDGYVKLIDLGVAREYKDKNTKDTVAFGTEGYAPPEQYGKAQTDARSDIYALGATMWHLLTGESPSEYPLPDIRTKNKSVGEGFAQVIVPKCTQLDRDLRYQDCNELISDLDVYQELTKEYFDKQRKKVRDFVRIAGSGLTMLLASLILFFIGNFMVTQNYNSKLEIGRTATSSEDKIAGFKSAISYKPGEKDPYIDLMNHYQKETGNGTEKYPIFTKDAFDDIHDLLEINRRSLISSGNYGDVCYEIGKAIWDNYDDGSNTSDVILRDFCMSKAKDYFVIARDNSKNSEIVKYSNMYINIAEFSEKIAPFKNDFEPFKEESNKFISDYFYSLEQLCTEAENNQSAKMKLNAYAIIQHGIGDNAMELKSVNISKGQIDKLLKRVSDGLNPLSFKDNPNYEKAKYNCINSLNSTVAAVERAYGNSSVGGK